MAIVAMVLMAAAPAAAKSASVQGTRGITAAAGSVNGCPDETFCAYPSPNYVGQPIFYYHCEFKSMPWARTGSWINNQTPGTEAKFYNSLYQNIYQTLPPLSLSSSYNWTPVFYIKPCGI